MADLGVELCTWDALPRADAIVAAVAHREYQELTTEDICRKLVRGGCFVDVKSAYDARPARDRRRARLAPLKPIAPIPGSTSRCRLPTT